MTKHRFYTLAVTLAGLVGAHLDHHDEAVVRGFFADLVAEILPVEAADAERAARLRADHRSLRLPDGLILAAAEVHPEFDMVLTGDAAMASIRGLGCHVKLLEAPGATDFLAVAVGVPDQRPAEGEVALVEEDTLLGVDAGGVAVLLRSSSGARRTSRKAFR